MAALRPGGEGLLSAPAAARRPVALLAVDLADTRTLGEALSARGVPVTVEVVGDLRLDLAVRSSPHGAVVNLVGESAPAAARALATEYLAYLADIEVPCVNGLDAFVVGASHARRLALLDHLGVAHPPARVVAGPGQVDAALADLGLLRDEARVSDGPPVVVQADPDVGPTVRIGYVAGRQVEAVADGAPVTVELGLGRLGASVVQTAGIEAGGVSFGVDPRTARPTCVDVDTEVPSSAAGLDALADHVASRAGLASA